TNRAWGDAGSRWWRKPLKALALLGIMIVAVLVGIAVPLLGNKGRSLLPDNMFLPWAYSLWLFFVPWLVLFAGLGLFYKLAPYRPTRFSEVWVPALCATLQLQAAAKLAPAGRKGLHATAAEPTGQRALRARRLGLAGPRLQVIAESDLAQIITAADDSELLVLDYIQAGFHPDVPALPRTISPGSSQT
ncbi:MAG: DNA repair protein RadA, partial [Hydrogenophaga sp.]